MKVLHINAGLEVGGGLTHIVSLLEKAKDVQENFELLTFADGPVAEAARKRGIKVTTLGKASRYDLSLPKRLKAFILEGGYDVVHTHGARANLFVSLIHKSLPCLWAVTVHSDPAIDFAGRGAAGALFTKLNLRAIRQADLVFAITQRFEKILTADGVDPQRIAVIYNGLNFTDNALLLPKKLHEGFNIVNVGRFEKVKGQDLLLRAVKKAADPQLVLHLVGAGSEEDHLRDLTKQLGLDQQVVFHGFLPQKEIKQLYQTMDLAVLSSYSESFPLVLLEAADNLLPLLTTDVGGVAVLIPDASCGRIVPVGDAAALAAGLNTFCQMPEGDRLAMAEKEKAYASHHFSLDQQLADIVTAYEAALDSKKG